MIKLQRRTFNAAKRREIIYDIQRYVSQHVYVIYGPSVMPVVAWESYVKNFGPNIGHDYGGRPLAAAPESPPLNPKVRTAPPGRARPRDCPPTRPPPAPGGGPRPPPDTPRPAAE